MFGRAQPLHTGCGRPGAVAGMLQARTAVAQARRVGHAAGGLAAACCCSLCVRCAHRVGNACTILVSCFLSRASFRMYVGRLCYGSATHHMQCTRPGGAHHPPLGTPAQRASCCCRCASTTLRRPEFGARIKQAAEQPCAAACCRGSAARAAAGPPAHASPDVQYV